MYRYRLPGHLDPLVGGVYVDEQFAGPAALPSMSCPVSCPASSTTPAGLPLAGSSVNAAYRSTSTFPALPSQPVVPCPTMIL